jgi:hypothetical protein
MRDEVRAVSAGMRRAMTRAAGQVQQLLRQQARGAGFRDGGRSLANAWRVNIYPTAPLTTLRPAALIWTKAPDIVAGFDSAQPISARHHKYLCWPTGYNATGGRVRAGGRGGMRITPSQMIGAQSFVLTSKHDRTVKLWCLRTRQGTSGKRGRLRVIVRAGTEVLTGRVKGRQAKVRDVLARGFVPMFFLVRSVTIGKRFDLDRVRQQAPGLLVAAMVQELRA